jgi:hypothetical protein
MLWSALGVALQNASATDSNSEFNLLSANLVVPADCRFILSGVVEKLRVLNVHKVYVVKRSTALAALHLEGGYEHD